MTEHQPLAQVLAAFHLRCAVPPRRCEAQPFRTSETLKRRNAHPPDSDGVQTFPRLHSY